MLLSMTGFGEARASDQQRHVWLELRSVNSKYFKCTIRSPEGSGQLEPLIENYIRERIRRGAVQVQLRLENLQASCAHEINLDVVHGYLQQITSLQSSLKLQVGAIAPIHWGELLSLPGSLVQSSAESFHVDEIWPLVQSALDQGLVMLEQTRGSEGAAIATDLLENCRIIETELEKIKPLTDQLAVDFRDRLLNRVGKLLAEIGVSVAFQDIVKEVTLFADRSDISEEIARLGMHLSQFRGLLHENESAGRKLEFVTQEMFREANTIGSKANHAGISMHVVAIKTSIERLREMIQNVE